MQRTGSEVGYPATPTQDAGWPSLRIREPERVVSSGAFRGDRPMDIAGALDDPPLDVLESLDGETRLELPTSDDSAVLELAEAPGVVRTDDFGNKFHGIEACRLDDSGIYGHD